MLSIFFVRFTCPGPFYTPLPSFQAHPSLFVSLMAFSSLPTFALSPYINLYMHVQYNLHYIMCIFCPLSSSDNRYARPYPFALSVSLQHGSPRCEKNIVSKIKEKEKNGKRKKRTERKERIRNDRVVSYDCEVQRAWQACADKSADLC